MDGHMLDGIWKALGCLVMLALLVGIGIGSCAKSCPYHVRVERAEGGER
jgi:Fe-S-cluster-containing dehydrogenase component